MSTPATLSKTVVFPLVILITTLRHMRNVRDAIRKDMQDLRDRQRSGHDGVHNATILALDAELVLVEDSVKLLWEAMGSVGPP